MTELKYVKLYEEFVNESTDNDFENWKTALAMYEKPKKTPAQDTALGTIFKGSKLTARFIFRAISAKNESLYKKDCAEFGKQKVDDLVERVIEIMFES